MHDRTAWARGTSGPQMIRGKSYSKLVEFKRPCATCGEHFSIFVTEKIASGHADSNSFGLKNCAKHRRNKSAADDAELETLRTANNTMRDELTAMYARDKLLFDEIQTLKARLARYELPAAMAALEPTTNRGPAANAGGSLTFPWGSG